VNPQETQRQVFLIHKSVASRVAHHRCGAGGTALLSQRCGLFNESEEWHWYIHSLSLLRFYLQSDAILSSSSDSTEQTISEGIYSEDYLSVLVPVLR